MPYKPSIPRICDGCGKPFLAYGTNVNKGMGRFCSRLCASNSRPPVSPEERFWRLVDKRGTNECWLWKGHLSKGYGKFQVGTRKTPLSPVRAHKFAYELLVGPVPDGLELDHLCSVRHCVNPAHLETVTHAENIRRALARRKVGQ